MADRIFPSNYSEDALDSELVFKGIDWDNFNTKLAEVQSTMQTTELPEEFKEVLAGKSDGIPQEVLDKWNSKKPKSKGNIEKLPGDEDSGLEGYVRKHKKDDDSDDDDDDTCKDCNKSKDKCKCKVESKKEVKSKDCTCGKTPCACTSEMKKEVKSKDSTDKKNEMKKEASFHFNHPSQIDASAVEAAISEGDELLVKAILAARQERRMRLANKIERTIIAQEIERNLKVANEKVQTPRSATIKKTSKENNDESGDSFVKVSKMSPNYKKAFAAKAIAHGFPQEYIEAMLGGSEAKTDSTVEIREVMSSKLNSNVKKTAVTSMVKEANLTNEDYSRLLDYWINELGYDKDWAEALFTKKYD
jgi:hypothetical protein